MNLDAFQETVLRAAAARQRQTRAEQAAALRAETERAVKTAQAQARERVDAARYKAALAYHKETAAAFNHTRLQLAARRASFLDGLFTQAAEALRAFVRSPAYGGYLAASLGARDITRFARLQVMARDEAVAPPTPGLLLETAEEDFIGGFRLLSADGKAIADYTLLAALQAQRATFPALYAEALRGGRDV